MITQSGCVVAFNCQSSPAPLDKLPQQKTRVFAGIPSNKKVASYSRNLRCLLVNICKREYIRRVFVSQIIGFSGDNKQKKPSIGLFWRT